MRDGVFKALIDIQASALVSPSRRRRLLHWCGISVPADATIYSGVFFGSSKVRLGAESFISIRCLFDGSDDIEIGEAVHLGCDVRLVTSSHDIGVSTKRAGPPKSAPIRIGRGAWIGAGATVLPGVTVAPGCVIAAGSVVTKDTTPNSLWLGQPARMSRNLDMNIVSDSPSPIPMQRIVGDEVDLRADKR